MKTLKDYLAESRRTYKYTIKMAFKPSDELLDQVEKALARYELISISKPKSLPIKKQDSDFQGIYCPETYAVHVEFAYPATPQMLQGTLSQVNMDLELVNVVSTDHDESVDKDETEITKNSDGALLNKPYPEQNNEEITKNNYGSEYNDKLVKNAMTNSITVPNPPAPAETTNDLPQGKLSPMGSKKNKPPNVKSFAR